MENEAQRKMTRRTAMLTAAGGSMAAVAPQMAMAQESSGLDEFIAAFRGLENALATGDLDGFYGAIHEGAIIYDEDIPFRMTKAGFKSHIDFHLDGLWEGFKWQARDPQFRVFGNTGIVGSFATFRGKPVDSGFRQRHMAFTQGWHKFDIGWRLITWHQSPFDGHILEASPG